MGRFDRRGNLGGIDAARRDAPARTTDSAGRDGTSRRDFIKSSAAGLIAGAFAREALADNAQRDDQVLERLEQGRDDSQRRILLKGGTIISMDPQVGNFAKGDVLIEGKKIAAVAPRVDSDAELIDATDMVVIPGFVDPHRHSWEGQLRGLNPNAVTLADYNAYTNQGFAPLYRPEDMYVGNLATALGCIDAGITCIIDNSHNSRSSAHSDAAIQALFDSGIRAVHASGAPQFGTWDHQWPQDLVRLQQTYFTSDDQLVTLRMFAGVNATLWQFARNLGLWVTTEGGGGAALPTVAALGLLDSHHTFNHMGATPDLNWQLIRDAGATVDVCPRSDPQYALSAGIPALQDALDHGMRPGLSVDNETSYSTDMFTEMRVAFFFQRGVRQNGIFKGLPNPSAPVKVQDILEFATVRGAWCAGLLNKIGTLTPGKEADIVLIRAEDINTMPLGNAFDTVVQQANAKNVDTVLIAGQVKKWQGKLVGVDLRRHRQRVFDSRQYLFTQKGFTLDVFG
jgi:5-methylthioadenosine/S-adenosylhomocysteine deaminase